MASNSGAGPSGQPRYDPTVGGHYGASAALAAQGHAPAPDSGGTWANVSQGLHGNYKDILLTYWQQQINHLEHENHDYKIHQLPLARIKKVMKADPEVKMISAEAPILFAKGCDIFITELTMRAWIHAEENKRRTLQRSDIASALSKSDMFDFLIDIVPREEAGGHAKRAAQGAANANATQTVPSAPGPLPTPQGSVQSSHPQVSQQHAMPPPDYLAHNSLPSDQEYRPTSTLYNSQVPSDPNNAYGQAPQQIFNEMYGYPSMPAQNMYHQVNQRGQDPSAGQDPNHYSQHEGGEGDADADAEGERDYEVR